MGKLNATNQLAVVDLMSGINSTNIMDAVKNLSEPDAKSPIDFHKTEDEKIPVEENESKEEKVEIEKVTEKAPASTQKKEKKEIKKEIPSTSDSSDPFSFENIIKKPDVDDKTTVGFCLYQETIDMLDAIKENCNSSVSKVAILHNFVATFLEQNKEILKKNKAAKPQKKNYLD